jgi:O-acetyl-ADP-ribose deacetylase (regulator of RNase III)
MIENSVKELAIPQIGCGIDGLKWDEVAARLNKVFDETDIEITVYKYVPK